LQFSFPQEQDGRYPHFDKESFGFSPLNLDFSSVLTTLGLMAFSVSYPYFNSSLEWLIRRRLGGISNMAPPADQIEFLTNQIPNFLFAVVLAAI